jgi:hypothetical protein
VSDEDHTRHLFQMVPMVLDGHACARRWERTGKGGEPRVGDPGAAHDPAPCVQGCGVGTEDRDGAT